MNNDRSRPPTADGTNDEPGRSWRHVAKHTRPRCGGTWPPGPARTGAPREDHRRRANQRAAARQRGGIQRTSQAARYRRDPRPGG
ncbi:conserved hypothetical protein [Ricinus communis]|uniref:Uncharacterized protein n=1 Tax=Ricinus communis TaxID=3988 RepID=B9TND9_RICCO|nr:conserved hypothetical protein [Ricinus communis]